MYDIFDRENWLKDQWENTNFGDKRINKRIAQLAEKILKKPHASLPNQLENWSDLKAAYRLLNNPKVDIENIQAQHRKNVLEKASQSNNPVLFIQDTSDLDYSNRSNGQDILGPIGHQHSSGVFIHTSLSLEVGESPSILGIASQIPWIRERKEPYSKSETRAQRKKRDTEALYWQKTLEKIGNPPPGKLWVSVGDRGNDIFSFLDYCSKNNWYFLVRTNQDRCVTLENGLSLNLKQYVRSLPIEGNRSFFLRGRNGIAARNVHMNVSWGKVLIGIPKGSYKGTTLCPVETTLIRCWENKPDGLEWILTTNLPVINIADALQKIDWYVLRWAIEEYHKCLKTGCAIEKRQMRTRKGLISMLAILGILATKILETKFIFKSTKNALAKKTIPLLFLKIICRRYKANMSSITLKDFWRMVANLGGFIGRKSDGDPGWQTLWKGWLRLLDMSAGAELLITCG